MGWLESPKWMGFGPASHGELWRGGAGARLGWITDGDSGFAGAEPRQLLWGEGWAQTHKCLHEAEAARIRETCWWGRGLGCPGSRLKGRRDWGGVALNL